jgi:hypothetical protein
MIKVEVILIFNNITRALIKRNKRKTRPMDVKFLISIKEKRRKAKLEIKYLEKLESRIC